MAPRKPAQTIRLGRIKVAIWKNQSEDGKTWFNVTVSRSYNEGGDWKDTDSYRRDDLPVVAKAMDMAYAWIWDQRETSRPEVVDDSACVNL